MNGAHLCPPAVLAGVCLIACQPAPPVPGLRFSIDPWTPRATAMEPAANVAGRPAPLGLDRHATSPRAQGTPVAPASGGAGGGAPSGAAVGQVFALSGDGETPLPGATVYTSDGRVGVAGSDGRFSLPGGLPTDGGLVVTHPGYVASAVVGLSGTGSIALHLRSATTLSNRPPLATSESFPVRGRVVAPNGLALPGVAVVLEDAQGAFSAPVETDADGRFTLTVFAPGRAVRNGTLLAAGGRDAAWLAIATGLSLMPEAPELPALVAVEADHQLSWRVAGNPSAVSIDLRGPDGTSLTLPVRGQAVSVADLPGVRYALRAEASDPASGTFRSLYREPLAIDFATQASLVEGRLLDAPVLQPSQTLIGGARLHWGAVAEAAGYHVTLGSESGGLAWEAYTPRPEIGLAPAVGLAPGLYDLSVTAWDGERVSPRSVAAARPLRFLPLTPDYRRASARATLRIE